MHRYVFFVETPGKVIVFAKKPCKWLCDLGRIFNRLVKIIKKKKWTSFLEAGVGKFATAKALAGCELMQ